MGQVSVEPYTWMSGTPRAPTLRTKPSETIVEPVEITRRLDRSALCQRTLSIIAINCAGTSTVSVMRSRSIVSSAASGSNFGCSVTVAPACSAGVVWMFSPPT